MRIFILFVIFITLSTAASASYKEALTMFEAKMYKDSLKMIASELDISRDLEENSPNYNLRYLAAHNHWKLGNLGSAIVHFKKCAEMKKEIPDPIIDLSLLMLDFKRYSEALRYSDGSKKPC